MVTKASKKATTGLTSVSYSWDDLRADIDNVLNNFPWLDTDIQWTKMSKSLRAKYPDGWNLLWQKYMNEANPIAAKNKDAFSQIQNLKTYMSSSESYKKYGANAVGPFWAFIRDIELITTLMYANINDDRFNHAISRISAWKKNQFLIADIQNKLVAEPVIPVAPIVKNTDTKDSKKRK